METCVEKTATRVTMEAEVGVLSYTPRIATRPLNGQKAGRTVP